MVLASLSVMVIRAINMKCLPLPLITMLICSIVAGCGKPKGGTEISRKDLVALIKSNQESEALICKLNEHFSEQGYTFEAIYQVGRSENISAKDLINSTISLQCDGVASLGDVDALDEELRMILNDEDHTGITVLYLYEVGEASFVEIRPKPNLKNPFAEESHTEEAE